MMGVENATKNVHYESLKLIAVVGKQMQFYLCIAFEKHVLTREANTITDRRTAKISFEAKMLQATKSICVGRNERF